MGQIVKRKKKGRPSKADLARRASEPATVPEIDVRRSLRRRNVRYNIDYDDYLDEDEEFVEVEEEEEEEEEVRRREKKLRLLMKLNQVSEKSESAGSRPGRSGTRGGHAQSDGGSGSEEEDEDESERKPLKKRRIDGVADDDGDDEEDEHVDEDEEERGGRKVDSTGGDSLPGTPSELPSRIPLPEKKTLELILDKLQKKDTYGVYAEPVDPEELPDYHDVIEHPMDFATVRKKLGNGSYTTLEQFESDVFLICSNAMQYNSAETVYHKQARSIQELARKKFYKLRIAFERTEKEVKSEQKPRSNSFVKKQIKKPVCRTSQELIGSDFSSGATLATPGDLHNSPIPTQAGGSEKLGNDDRLVDNISSFADMNQEKTDELSSGKGFLSKLGKKSLVLDENRRATYNISNQPVARSDSVFTTFEGELRQLVAVGLHAEYSYARSLARFAATIGPVAWKIASQRIEQALPDGCKFGRGWVGEYEPLPTPVLMVENCTRKEPALARRSQTSAGLRKVDETFRTSLSPREHAASRPTPERKSSPFAPSGPSLEGKPSLFAPSGTRQPSSTINATLQQCNQTPRNFTEPQNKDIKQAELISPSSARQNSNNNNNNSNFMPERKLSNSSEVTTSRGREGLSRNTNVLQPSPFMQQQQQQQHSNGNVTGGLPNGRGTVTGSSNRMTSPSPDAVPNQMARTATYFPRGQEQGLTDPVQLMRMLSEKSQMQQKSSNQPPVDTPPETPPVLSVRREDSTNAASVAARAWMSIGAAGFKQPAENSSMHKDQISADSLYNPTRELHPQFSRVREEFPPGGMQFRPEMAGFPHPKMVPQQIRMSNEVQQLQNRPMIFPQFVAADLSRFQVQPPWRSLSPRSQPRQKRDTFPPDLNIGFQSPGSPAKQSSGVMVDSQQPDLALQL